MDGPLNRSEYKVNSEYGPSHQVLLWKWAQSSIIKDPSRGVDGCIVQLFPMFQLLKKSKNHPRFIIIICSLDFSNCFLFFIFHIKRKLKENAFLFYVGLSCISGLRLTTNQPMEAVGRVGINGILFSASIHTIDSDGPAWAN